MRIILVYDREKGLFFCLFLLYFKKYSSATLEVTRGRIDKAKNTESLILHLVPTNILHVRTGPMNSNI